MSVPGSENRNEETFEDVVNATVPIGKKQPSILQEDLDSPRLQIETKERARPHTGVTRANAQKRLDKIINTGPSLDKIKRSCNVDEMGPEYDSIPIMKESPSVILETFTRIQPNSRLRNRQNHKSVYSTQMGKISGHETRPSTSLGGEGKRTLSAAGSRGTFYSRNNVAGTFQISSYLRIKNENKGNFAVHKPFDAYVSKEDEERIMNGLFETKETTYNQSLSNRYDKKLIVNKIGRVETKPGLQRPTTASHFARRKTERTYSRK